MNPLSIFWAMRARRYWERIAVDHGEDVVFCRNVARFYLLTLAKALAWKWSPERIQRELGS